jgi:xanthine dehydrogenase small subunit
VPAGCLEDRTAGAVSVRVATSDTSYRNGEQIFHLPKSLADLAALRLQSPDALLLGGGTDLGLRVSKEREAFPAVIWTGGIPELKRIADKDGALEFGAAVTYSEALPLLEQHFPSFAALVRRIGSRQIRNLGTFAGNLATASPIGDTIPCLIALGAEVQLRAKTGSRWIPVEEFITGYRKTAMAADEFIEAIRIPLLDKGRIFTAYKLSKRFDQDISTVIAAFNMSLVNGVVRDVRAAFGGMAAQVARATRIERALVGKAWTEDALTGIDPIMAQDFKPMSDHRGGAEYRLRAAANLVRRFQVETSSAQPAQVWVL